MSRGETWYIAFPFEVVKGTQQGDVRNLGGLVQVKLLVPGGWESWFRVEEDSDLPVAFRTLTAAKAYVRGLIAEEVKRLDAKKARLLGLVVSANGTKYPDEPQEYDIWKRDISPTREAYFAIPSWVGEFIEGIRHPRASEFVETVWAESAEEATAPSYAFQREQKERGEW